MARQDRLDTADTEVSVRQDQHTLAAIESLAKLPQSLGHRHTERDFNLEFDSAGELRGFAAPIEVGSECRVDCPDANLAACIEALTQLRLGLLSRSRETIDINLPEEAFVGKAPADQHERIGRLETGPGDQRVEKIEPVLVCPRRARHVRAPAG